MGVKKETRSAALDRIVAREFEKGTTLPATRRVAAKELGGAENGSGYLGTVDPRYYRLAGLATPLPAGKYANAKGEPTAALAKAIRKRRDSGVRWNVLAASVEAATGRVYSEPVVRALYAKGGGDVDSSYVGRGTRIGAPATYADPAAEARAPEAEAVA